MRAPQWHQLKAAIHRRDGRIEGILLIIAMLLPQSIITLLGGH
jgi:hypothetical protein